MYLNIFGVTKQKLATAFKKMLQKNLVLAPLICVELTLTKANVGELITELKFFSVKVSH